MRTTVFKISPCPLNEKGVLGLRNELLVAPWLDLQCLKGRITVLVPVPRVLFKDKKRLLSVGPVIDYI